MDQNKLEGRIRKAGLLNGKVAFGAFAVEYLRMPVEAMPFLNANDDLNANLRKKADKKYVPLFLK